MQVAPPSALLSNIGLCMHGANLEWLQTSQFSFVRAAAVGSQPQLNLKPRVGPDSYRSLALELPVGTKQGFFAGLLLLPALHYMTHGVEQVSACSVALISSDALLAHYLGSLL